MTVAILVVLALWLAASIANQVPGPWTSRLGRLNALSLLPALFFFAPDPIDVDYYLVFRDFGADGEAGPWRPVPKDKHGPLRVLWSTAKRDHQAMTQAVAAMANLQTMVAPLVDDADAVLQLSIPYLFLLHMAMGPPPAPGAQERQFMVVETSGFLPDRGVALGILSNAHRL